MNDFRLPSTYDEKVSKIENELFNSVIQFKNHLNLVRFEEKDILEIIGIAFYGGKFISKTENQLKDNLFNKYVTQTITYYSNSLKYYDGTSLNICEKDILEYIENEKNICENISYKTILYKISTFLKNKYMENKNEYSYTSNYLYRNSFIETSININAMKYIQFIIIGEFIDDFSSLLSMYNNGSYISKKDILTLYEECLNNHSETLFIEKVSNIYGKDTKENIYQYIDNILKNVIHTPYYYEEKYIEYFQNMLKEFSNKMEINIKPENYQLFNFIENIKKNIVKKGIEARNNIDNDYQNICMEAIINNKLNINEFTTKTFYEYFMTSKSEAKLAIILDNSNNILQSISK